MDFAWIASFVVSKKYVNKRKLQVFNTDLIALCLAWQFNSSGLASSSLKAPENAASLLQQYRILRIDGHTELTFGTDIAHRTFRNFFSPFDLYIGSTPSPTL